MADEVAIKFGADLSGALDAAATLKQALAGIAEPIPRLKASFAELDAAMQPKAALAALAQFRAQMQQLVSERAISLRQALGFDIEYTAQLNDEERARLEAVLAADTATVADKTRAFGQLLDLSARYSADVARDQQKLADTAAREADRLARPFRQAFAEIGLGWQRAAVGLIEGTLSFRGAALEAARAVERGFVSMTETVISKAAAGPLASLLGQPAARAGEGVADVLGNTASRWIFGMPQQLGEAAATAANTAALNANGASWSPNLTWQYSLTDSDFLPWQETAEGGSDPVLLTRADPAQATNWLSLEYMDAGNSYNPQVVAAYDQGLVDQYGLRSEPSIQAHEFTNPTSAAVSAQLLLQRRAYIRNTYRFKLGWRYALLEPMDIVLISDAALGLVNAAVRITEIAEDDNGELTVTAEEIPGLTP